MNPNNKFPEDFFSFINALNNRNVEYLLIGGFKGREKQRDTEDLGFLQHLKETIKGRK
jgi:hypothetical protein